MSRPCLFIWMACVCWASLFVSLLNSSLVLTELLYYGWIEKLLSFSWSCEISDTFCILILPRCSEAIEFFGILSLSMLSLRMGVVNLARLSAYLLWLCCSSILIKSNDLSGNLPPIYCSFLFIVNGDMSSI